MGARLKNAKIIGNVKIDPKLDKAINDDVKAHESITALYGNNFNEYSLSQIFKRWSSWNEEGQKTCSNAMVNYCNR